MAFPIVAAVRSEVGASIKYYVDHGMKRVALAYGDFPGLQEELQIVQQAVPRIGGVYAGGVQMPLDATSFAQFAQQLKNSNAEGVFIIGSAAEVSGLISAGAQINYKPKWGIISGEITPAQEKQLGSLGDGALIASPAALATDTAVPGIAEYNKDMNAEESSNKAASVRDGGSLIGWIAVEALAKVLNAAPGSGVDAAALLSALKHATNVNLMGVTPLWSPSATGPSFAPRETNGAAYFGVLQDGKEVALKDAPPINAFLK